MTGPVCWAKAPPGWVECGAGAAEDDDACADALKDQIWSVTSLAIDTGLAVATAGTSKAATVPTKIAAKIKDIAKTLKKVKEFVDGVLKFESIKQYTSDVEGVVENLVAQNKLTPVDQTRITLTLASIADPIGILDIAAAYTYDTCDKIVSASDPAAIDDIVTLFAGGTFMSFNDENTPLLSWIPSAYTEWTMGLHKEEGLYSLRSKNGKYLSARDDNTVTLVDHVQDWEKFTKIVDDSDDKLFSWKTFHGTILTVTDTGSIKHFQDGGEKWSFSYSQTMPVYSFQSKSHGNFLSARDDGSVSSTWVAQGWESFRMVENFDGTISLLSFHDKYLSGSGKTLTLQPHNLQHEKWNLVSNGDGSVSLQQSVGDGLFLGIHQDGAYLTEDNGAWEKFMMGGTYQSSEHGTFLSSKVRYIRSHHGSYLRTKDDGNIDAVNHAQQWEKWEIVTNADGTVSLLGWHNKYLSAHTDGSFYVADAIDIWESFTEEFDDSGLVSFKTHHNTYLKIDPDGKVSQTGNKGDWEKFRYEVILGQEADASEQWSVIESGDEIGSFALRDKNGLYLSATGDTGKATLVPWNRGHEKFVVEFADTGETALYSVHKNQYLKFGKDFMLGFASNLDDWEKVVIFQYAYKDD